MQGTVNLKNVWGIICTETHESKICRKYTVAHTQKLNRAKTTTKEYNWKGKRLKFL